MTIRSITPAAEPTSGGVRSSGRSGASRLRTVSPPSASAQSQPELAWRPTRSPGYSRPEPACSATPLKHRSTRSKNGSGRWKIFNPVRARSRNHDAWDPDEPRAPPPRHRLDGTAGSRSDCDSEAKTAMQAFNAASRESIRNELQRAQTAGIIPPDRDLDHETNYVAAVIDGISVQLIRGERHLTRPAITAIVGAHIRQLTGT